MAYVQKRNGHFVHFAFWFHRRERALNLWLNGNAKSFWPKFMSVASRTTTTTANRASSLHEIPLLFTCVALTWNYPNIIAHQCCCVCVSAVVFLFHSAPSTSWSPCSCMKSSNRCIHKSIQNTHTHTFVGRYLQVLVKTINQMLVFIYIWREYGMVQAWLNQRNKESERKKIGWMWKRTKWHCQPTVKWSQATLFLWVTVSGFARA